MQYSFPFLLYDEDIKRALNLNLCSNDVWPQGGARRQFSLEH